MTLVGAGQGVGGVTSSQVRVIAIKMETHQPVPRMKPATPLAETW